MFFRKKVEKLEIKTDIHSHLLPIDDGVKSFDESLKLISKFISLGYQKLIITPHVMEDSFNNSTEYILENFERLKEEVKKAGLHIGLDISAEYYMDEEFARRLEKKDLIPIKNRYILFETSYYEKPLNLEEMVFKILSKGYIPVFAHPERYRYITDMDYYFALKEKGVLFQCNIISFGSFYGKTAYKKAKFLAKNGLVDFLGSDAHSIKYVEFLSQVLEENKFNQLLKGNKIKNNELI